jgi:hypothetical protein
MPIDECQCSSCREVRRRVRLALLGPRDKGQFLLIFDMYRIGDKVKFLGDGGYGWSTSFRDCYGIVKVMGETRIRVTIYNKAGGYVSSFGGYENTWAFDTEDVAPWGG